MWLYLVLLVLPIGMLVAKRRASLDSITALVVWFALTIWVGLRRGVGGDWNNYELLFERAAANPLIIAIGSIDAGYAGLSKLVAAMGFGIGVLNLLSAATFSAGLVLFCRRQPYPALAMLIALPVLVLVVAHGYTRQSVAVGLVMIALSGYSNGKKALGHTFLAAAGLFHYSAIVFLPLALTMGGKLRLPLWAALGLGLGAGAGASLVLPSLDPSIAPAIVDASVAGGALFRLAPTFAALGVFLLWRRRFDFNEGERAIAVYLSAITLLLAAMIFTMPTAADRLGLYTVPFQMMIFSHALRTVPSERWRVGAGALLSAGYIVLFVGWLALSPYGRCWSPYRSYISSPSELLRKPGQRVAFDEPAACRDVKRASSKQRPGRARPVPPWARHFKNARDVAPGIASSSSKT